MTAADSSSPGVSVRGNLVIGVASILAGAVVIPYGASMPYVREGIPGPGLFPMMIGGMLILLGVLMIVTSLLSSRRERLHREQLAVAEAEAPPEDATSADAAASAGADPAPEGDATIDADPAAGDRPGSAPADPSSAAEAAAAGPVASSVAEDASAAAVPGDADDVPQDQLEATAVMDTDIGSDGARRWINGAILMGGIVFFVVFAEILGFPLTMAILVTAIVWSLRARWWAAVLTGVLTAIGLWLMFEQGLLVQLPDGPFRGF